MRGEAGVHLLGIPGAGMLEETAHVVVDGGFRVGGQGHGDRERFGEFLGLSWPMTRNGAAIVVRRRRGSRPGQAMYWGE
ncbi:MAG TPA: hypothetical protein VK063_01545 [Beutenbergiaceae bacterium]|nr:hypothetical protein [Beutenbergiaceae bacterium]